MCLHGIPDNIRCDNGPEMISKALRKWVAKTGPQIQYIAPGSPWENGVISLQFCAVSPVRSNDPEGPLPCSTMLASMSPSTRPGLCVFDAAGQIVRDQARRRSRRDRPLPWASRSVRRARPPGGGAALAVAARPPRRPWASAVLSRPVRQGGAGRHAGQDRPRDARGIAQLMRTAGSRRYTSRRSGAGWRLLLTQRRLLVNKLMTSKPRFAARYAASG